jgi:hypothetical protein
VERLALLPLSPPVRIGYGGRRRVWRRITLLQMRQRRGALGHSCIWNYTRGRARELRSGHRRLRLFHRVSPKGGHSVRLVILHLSFSTVYLLLSYIQVQLRDLCWAQAAIDRFPFQGRLKEERKMNLTRLKAMTLQNQARGSASDIYVRSAENFTCLWCSFESRE